MFKPADMRIHGHECGIFIETWLAEAFCQGLLSSMSRLVLTLKASFGVLLQSSYRDHCSESNACPSRHTWSLAYKVQHLSDSISRNDSRNRPRL